MQRDPRAYLFDIQIAAEAILQFVGDADFETFARNDLMRSAVERKFEIIGEALNRLVEFAPDLATQVSKYRKIIDFRNFLIHGYDIVNPETVWLAALNSLPSLRAEIKALLEATPPPSP